MNGSESFSFSEIGKEWGISKILLFTFLCLVTLITIFGNAVVIYVFAKSPQALRSPIHLLLANLAFADFLVGVMVMPGLTFFTVLDYKWIFGEVPCKLHDYVHFSLCGTSTLSMVVICGERYVGLKYPMHHKRILTTRRVRLVCAAVWIMAILLTSASLTIWPNRESPSLYTCPPNLRHDFLFFISVSVYWLPIATMAYIYWLIYKVSAIPAAELMKWANKSLGSTIVSTTATSTVSRNRGNKYKSDEERWEKASQKQKKLLIQVSKLVGVMLLFYGPLFGIFAVNSFHPNWFSLNTLVAFAWLRYFTSCSNTFLYIHVMPYYKSQLLRLVCNVRRSNGAGGDQSEVSNSRELSSSHRGSYARSYSVKSAGEAMAKIEMVDSSGPSTQVVTLGAQSETQRSNQKCPLGDKRERIDVDIDELDKILAQINSSL